MKKLLAIFLMVIYITTTSGIALSIHYCMGNISSVVIGQNTSTTCPTCGMENEGCCHDDFKVVKLTDSHQAPFLVNELQKPIITKPEPVVPVYPSLPAQENYIFQQDHSPPPAHSLNILYCVFRI